MKYKLKYKNLKMNIIIVKIYKNYRTLIIELLNIKIIYKIKDNIIYLKID